MPSSFEIANPNPNAPRSKLSPFEVDAANPQMPWLGLNGESKLRKSWLENALSGKDKVVYLTKYLGRNLVTAIAEKILGNNRTFEFKLADGSPATMVFRGVKADASLVKGLDEAFRINPEIFNPLVNPDVVGTKLILFNGTMLEIYQDQVNPRVSKIIVGGVEYSMTLEENGKYIMRRAA
jgi:hypothetical protein